MTTGNRVLIYGSLLTACLSASAAAYSIASNRPVQIKQTPAFSPALRPASITPVVEPNQPNEILGAVGIVEPSSELIPIGSTVAGVVTRVAIRPGDTVAPGDVLFVVDERSALAEVEAAEKDLDSALAKLRETEAQIRPTAARVALNEASVRLARLELAEREQLLQTAERLSARDAIPREDLDRKRYACESAAARVAEAEAKLEESRANLALLLGSNGTPAGRTGNGPTIEVQRAAVAKIEAALAQARVRLALQTIRAPIAATVLQVRIRVGQFVPAATTTEPPAILGVDHPMHVRTEIDEAEIGRFRPDARAIATLRGQADCQAELRFVRVEPLIIPKRVLTGAASERVDTRVLQVIYALDPTGFPARPGQQVDVYIGGVSAGSVDSAAGSQIGPFEWSTPGS